MEKSATITILVLSILLAFGLGSLFGYNISENKSELSFLNAKSDMVEVPLPNGNVIKVPSGHRVRVRMQTGGQQISKGTYKDKTIGDALGGHKINPGATDLTNISTPTLDLTEGKESGSGGAIASMQKAAQNGTTIIIVAGIVFLAAGILVIILLKMIKLGLAVSGIGVALIGTGLLVQAYPWVLLIAIGVIVIGIAGFIWWAWKTGRIKFTTETIVAAIKKTDPEVQQAVKAQITEEASDPKSQTIVKSTVNSIKNKLN